MNPQLSKRAVVVSVIIPTYNDHDRLTRCLDMLHRQTYPESLTEILVVDNGSDTMINLDPSRYPLVKLLNESTRGSYAARNTGISAARGDILAFTDADCVPESEWIAHGVQALRDNSDVGIICGKIEVFPKISNKPTIYEHYDRLFGFQQEYWARHFKYGACANIFTYRAVMNEVGFFNPLLMSLGDSEWCVRATKQGHKLIYSDKPLVRHPARASFNALMNKTLRTTGGVYETINKQDHRKHVSSKRSIFMRLIKPNNHSIQIIFNDKTIPSLFKKLMVLVLGVSLRVCRIYENIRLTSGAGSRNT